MIASRRGSARRIVHSALAIGLFVGVATIARPTGPSEAALPVSNTFDATERPFGAISVIGDSVLLGSAITSPTIGHELAARGWGPIRVRAGGSYSTGAFPVTLAARASYWVGVWRSQGWDAPNVVVNLGTNDSGFCTRSLSCARDAIMHMVDAIGPGHRIWWPKVTRSSQHQSWATTWNTALDQIGAERGDFFTWDWPTVMATGGFRSGDNIHLSPDGYRKRSALMAAEITRVLTFATRIGADADLPTPSGPPSEVLPVGPVRVLDTRSDQPGRLTGGTAVTVDVSDHVPADTTAVAVYVTATGTADQGYLTAYECSAGRPTASAVNYRVRGTRGAVTITPVSSAGTFCLVSRADTDVVVDLQAAFVTPLATGGSGGSRFTPLATPTRLLDTRTTGRAHRLQVHVPNGRHATMAAVSIAAIGGQTNGFLTAHPCLDDLPAVATVNHGVGDVVAGSAFVPLTADGAFCVFAKADVDITVDLTGIFSPDGDLLFRPAPPTRTIDTRSAIGGWGPIHGRLQTIDARVAPPSAEAVSGTLTIVRPSAQGHLRAWGCGPLPDTANVNAGTGEVTANSLTTAVDADGRLCVYARSTTSTVFDTTGWWIRLP